MTTVTPIYDSLRLLRYALTSALSALTTSGVYWEMAPESAALPLIVVQSQDRGGLGLPHLAALGWQGQVTVKALASTLGAAESLLEQVAPGMDDLEPPLGYGLVARYLQPIAIPPEGGVYQVGHMWMVTLERI